MDAHVSVGVPRETFTGEKRVAITPNAVPALHKAGIEVLVEFGAGRAAGFPDEAYRDKGANVVRFRNEVFSADVVARVRALNPNLEASRPDLERLRSGQVLIGFCDPLTNRDAVMAVAERGVTLFAMELIPRITRAQSMDALSSQATVAGYKAVLLAAHSLPKMFPMLTTAAGTVPPARVFVVGAGVAGLQAIATAKRLGAVVEAYDVRPEVKEQVMSVGAKFVEFELESDDASGSGGYAKEMGEEFYTRQREMMARVVAASDVVVTTAAIPGRPAPRLITAEMVAGMQPGAVIVDLAAAGGGNCELTRRDEVVVENGVTIFGPTNLPATAPYQASSMYAKNVSTFLVHLMNEGRLAVDQDDQITRETLVAHGGDVVNPRLREEFGMPDRDVEAEGAGEPRPAVTAATARGDDGSPGSLSAGAEARDEVQPEGVR